MVRSSSGLRRGTRRKLKAGVKHKFKVTPYITEFKIDDKVVIKLNPSSHNGKPFPKFKGKIGIVKGKRGDAYILEVAIGNSKKEIISRPEHLVLKK